MDLKNTQHSLNNLENLLQFKSRKRNLSFSYPKFMFPMYRSLNELVSKAIASGPFTLPTAICSKSTSNIVCVKQLIFITSKHKKIFLFIL